MTNLQWFILGWGFVIAGVTVWYALNGIMPDDLGVVITGTLLSIGSITLALVGLEKKEGDQ